MIRVRRPSVVAVLLTIFGVSVFCVLGVWQLRRANYKQTVMARFHDAARAPLVSLHQALSDPQENDYPHVKVKGWLDGRRTYLLDDQRRQGRLGVMVFVPFRPAGTGRTLLVNLGFLAKQGTDGTRLPDLPPIPTHEVTLSGIYAPPPPPGLKLGGNPLTREKSWPKLVTWIDTGEIAKDLHQALLPHVLLLDSTPDSPYLRRWTPNVMPPARNRAYAFQWFTFAAAVVAIFFVLHLEKRDAAHRHSEG
jgi:cytochrome oxidase assembly protein ShyY1